MKIDLHVHSAYSHDSFAAPQRILRTARQRGLDAVAITDHETMAAYARIDPEPDLILVPGMEVKTDRGDVIGLFLSDEIRARIFADVVDEIRGQSGIVVLPHPYRRRCDPADLAGAVDLVEVINARSRDEENQRAAILAKSAGKPSIAGSDAHTTREIGTAGTALMADGSDLDDLRRALLSASRVCFGLTSPFLLSHGYTYVASRMKRVLAGVSP